MKTPSLALMAAILFSFGCHSQQSPFPTQGWSINLRELEKLREGDTVEVVIQKLGSPMHVEVILPWLTYEAADKKGFYYLVTFKLRSPAELNLDDQIARVSLASTAVNGPEAVIVWPSSKKK